MKKSRFFILSFLMIFLLNVSANAVTAIRKADLTFKDIKITVDGNAIASDTDPFIYDNRVYVPARAVAEAMGGSVEWNADENKVEIVNVALARCRVLGTGIANVSVALEEYSELLAALNDLIDERNNVVVGGKGSNHDEIKKRRADSLDKLEKDFNDFIKKDSDIWSENTGSASSVIQLAIEIALAYNPETTVTRQHLDEGINLFNWSVDNIRKGYECIEKYDIKQDPIYLEQYSIYHKNALDNYKKGYQMFLDLIFAFQDIMYML